MCDLIALRLTLSHGRDALGHQLLHARCNGLSVNRHAVAQQEEVALDLTAGPILRDPYAVLVKPPERQVYASEV